MRRCGLARRKAAESPGDAAQRQHRRLGDSVGKAVRRVTMPYYLVSGKIEVYTECFCEDCDGHHTRYGKVEDEDVEAKTPEEAAEKVLHWEADDIAGQMVVTDCWWEDPPTVKELPTDQVMRRRGAPMLFDVPPETLGHMALVEAKK
jgi:hypothetical protein